MSNIRLTCWCNLLMNTFANRIFCPTCRIIVWPNECVQQMSYSLHLCTLHALWVCIRMTHNHCVGKNHWEHSGRLVLEIFAQVQVRCGPNNCRYCCTSWSIINRFLRYFWSLGEAFFLFFIFTPWSSISLQHLHFFLADHWSHLVPAPFS